MNSHEELVPNRLMSHVLSDDRSAHARFGRFLYTRTNQVLIDAAIIAAALWFAYMIRFDGVLPEESRKQFLIVVPFAVLLYTTVSVVSGLYNRVWRYVNLSDAVAMANAVAFSTLVSTLWRAFDSGALTQGVIPFGVLLIHPFIIYSGMIGVRLARRLLYQRDATTTGQETKDVAVRKQVLLIGAGEAGLQLLRELSASAFEVVGFLDDDLHLKGRRIGGWRVLGTTSDLEAIARKYYVDEVIFCMPRAPKAAVLRLAARCARIPVKTSSVPTLWEIMSGKVMINDLRSINMEDLLGRDSISHPRDLDQLMRSYRGCRILVTGAGGSIGSELVRQLKDLRPSELILLDKDENNLYEVTCEIREDFPDVTEVVADIRDYDRMRNVFERQKPEIVFHAAAYKHVPLMEHYPAEAILNNVIGTRHVANLSNQFGVKAFVLVSTDKAVNPSSTMGASKRVAEMIVQQLAATGTKTRFCCVRFGNVLGSRASVVPLFQRQIRQGRNITVTHPEVCRYFMTIPEAVQLVIQAGSLGSRGEIFLLDMGDPVKIVDLARNLIELSGLVPNKDVKIEFTGLRPGEKLNEELLIAGERGIRSTKYAKIFVVEALGTDWSYLHRAVEDLESAAHAGAAGEIRSLLRSLGIGYHNDDFTNEIPEARTGS
jgi:FlaA1/EpsC-like NDP-sugar epimerase